MELNLPINTTKRLNFTQESQNYQTQSEKDLDKGKRGSMSHSSIFHADLITRDHFTDYPGWAIFIFCSGQEIDHFPFRYAE